MLSRRAPETQPEGIVAGYAQTSQRWPSQPLVRRPLTRTELTGPREVTRRLAPVRGDLAGHGEKRAIGQLIHIRARVVDEDGAPVAGAVVEIWHCNAAGKVAADRRQPADEVFGTAQLGRGERPAHERLRWPALASLRIALDHAFGLRARIAPVDHG